MKNFQLIIRNGDKLLQPAVLDGATWETARKGAPGKLTFQVVKDDLLDFQEGNPVRVSVDGADVFYGFVFTKKRNKDNIIEVTAYDQLRYLKNKHSMKYVGITASEVIKRLAAVFQLNVGEIDDTEYVIPRRIEDNVTLFDMIYNALDSTLQNKKKMYVLYDDVGQLMLKDIENMKLNLLIDSETGENFSYESSIDRNTFNRIKLYYENKSTGKREVFVSPQDPKEFTVSENIKKWGVLQYCEAIDEKTVNPQAKADALLQLYNRKTRSLSIDNAFGDVRIRGGSGVMVRLNLGDVSVNNYMIVENAKHVFSNKEHMMSLNLRGGEFV